MPPTATSAVAFSLFRWNGQEKKDPVYATCNGLIELKTISWCDVSYKICTAALQPDLNEVQVELLVSKEQLMMQLYSSRYLNNAYRFS